MPFRTHTPCQRVMLRDDDTGLASLYRMTRAGQFVPIAPANCCKMCLSDIVRPIDECADLNMCSGHGMCVTAACECMPGWSGADCSNQVMMVQSAPDT